MFFYFPLGWYVIYSNKEAGEVTFCYFTIHKEAKHFTGHNTRMA